MNQSHLKSTRRSQEEDFFWRSLKSQTLLSYEESIALTRKVQLWRSLSEEELNTPNGKAIASSGLKAKNTLITQNMRLVAHCAHRMRLYNSSFELMDLIQEGAIGLAHGIDLFDPAKGYRLSTYVIWWIKQSMRRAIADKGRTIRLPIHVNDKISKIRRACYEFSKEFSRHPTLQELAIAIDMPADTIERLLQRYGQTKTASLDSLLYGDEQDGCLMDVIPDRQSGNHLEALETIDEVERWISYLPSDRQRFVAQRYLVDQALGEDVSLESIGREFEEKFGKKISRQAVQNNLKQVRYHLKTFAKNQGKPTC